jgi:hypothetical protein
MKDLIALLRAVADLLESLSGALHGSAPSFQRARATKVKAPQAMRRSRRSQNRPPNDALYRLGKKIERELNIPPRPSKIDPATGRCDPPGFYTFNHYTGKSMRPK